MDKNASGMMPNGLRNAPTGSRSSQYDRPDGQPACETTWNAEDLPWRVRNGQMRPLVYRLQGPTDKGCQTRNRDRRTGQTEIGCCHGRYARSRACASLRGFDRDRSCSDAVAANDRFFQEQAAADSNKTCLSGHHMQRPKRGSNTYGI